MDKPISRSEMQLVEKAIKLGWPIEQETKEIILAQANEVLTNPDSRPRDKARASRLIMAMNAQNIEVEKMSNITTGVNINVEADSPENAKRIANELIHDPEYARYCRQRAADHQSGDVCTGGEQRLLEADTPSGTD